MRQLMCCLLVIATLFVADCHKQRAWPASEIKVADLRARRQLIFGFYDADSSGGWRWCAPVFSVALNPPDSYVERPRMPAKLSLELFFPQPEIDVLGPITLTASTDGRVLGRTTYTKAGSHLFTATVPAEVLHTNMLPVLFSLDKFIPASKADPRNLGAVITSISLKSER
jgi:hypothetical protein